MEQTELQKLHARVQALEDEREAVRPEATPPSQWRNSMASTERPLEPVFTAPASYPVDAITEAQDFHL